MSKRDFFDPRWEDTNVVLIDAPTLRRAERRIKSCETCTPDAAEIPFDWLLDRITRDAIRRSQTTCWPKPRHVHDAIVLCLRKPWWTCEMTMVSAPTLTCRIRPCSSRFPHFLSHPSNHCVGKRWSSAATSNVAGQFRLVRFF